MIFIYAFYIDLFVEQNFLMNLIVLSLTETFCKSPVSHRVLRMLLAAFCGVIAQTLLLLFGPGYGWTAAGFALLVVPFMIFTSFGWNGRRGFLTRVGISWLSIVILNGVAEAVQNVTGISCLTLYAGIVVLMLARILTVLMLASLKKQSRMYVLTFVEGASSVRCLGLLDTGNLLSIPDTGEPVHIVSPAVVQKLGIDESDGIRLIPYHALGTEEGWIRVLQVERLLLRAGRVEKAYERVWCGVAEEALLKGRSYQAILNAGLQQMHES